MLRQVFPFSCALLFLPSCDTPFWTIHTEFTKKGRSIHVLQYKYAPLFEAQVTRSFHVGLAFLGTPLGRIWTCRTFCARTPTQAPSFFGFYFGGHRQLELWRGGAPVCVAQEFPADSCHGHEGVFRVLLQVACRIQDTSGNVSGNVRPFKIDYVNEKRRPTAVLPTVMKSFLMLYSR
jgi:hypothetical protein